MVLSTEVNGVRQPLANAMPSKLSTVTLAFATGECGSENWAGIPADAMANGLQPLIDAGKTYIISTGGAAGSFTCGSDQDFLNFIERYRKNSPNMLGVDFDIESGQSVDVIKGLVARVKNVQAQYPTMRFSFTVATNGAASYADNLGPTGQAIMGAIKEAGLTNYIINLMVMDYYDLSNCVVGANGKCDMGKSANAAAITLHNHYGVPYSQIELTPLIGVNDDPNEIFTLADATTMSVFVTQNKLAGVHYWALDRDRNCASGLNLQINCNGSNAGTLGFTNAFITNLGL
jgi:hypothetical protein